MYNPCLHTGCDIRFEDIEATAHGDLFRIEGACLFYHNGWMYGSRPDSVDYELRLHFNPSLDKDTQPYRFIFFPAKCLTPMSQQALDCIVAQGMPL